MWCWHTETLLLWVLPFTGLMRPPHRILKCCRIKWFSSGLSLLLNLAFDAVVTILLAIRWRPLYFFSSFVIPDGLKVSFWCRWRWSLNPSGRRCSVSRVKRAFYIDVVVGDNLLLKPNRFLNWVKSLLENSCISLSYGWSSKSKANSLNLLIVLHLLGVRLENLVRHLIRSNPRVPEVMAGDFNTRLHSSIIVV